MACIYFCLLTEIRERMVSFVCIYTYTKHPVKQNFPIAFPSFHFAWVGKNKNGIFSWGEKEREWASERDEFEIKIK